MTNPSHRTAPSAPRSHRIARSTIAGLGTLAAAAALALAAAAPASAHVSVNSSSTAPGGWSVLTFKVPTESPTAATIAVTVHLPEDTPFTSVLNEPVPGWTAELTTEDLPEPVAGEDGDITSAVTEVTWTAVDGGLAPGQFGEFKLSVGPLPDSGTVYLPVDQTYSDGTVVAWSQQAEGGAEAEHPAPSLIVSADPATAGAHGESAGTDASAGADASAAGSAAAGVPWGTGFGILGTVIAVAALVVAALALRGSRRGSSTAPEAHPSARPAGAATRVDSVGEASS